MQQAARLCCHVGFGFVAATLAQVTWLCSRCDKEIALMAYDFYQEGLRMQAMINGAEMG